MTNTQNFCSIWFNSVFNNIEQQSIIDTGASKHNLIPLKIANKLGLKPIFLGRTVTTIGNEQVQICQAVTLDFEINGFRFNQTFHITDADFDFILFGMPFVDSLSSINFNNKTIYSGKIRFPFTKNRFDINHLYKRQKAALIVYALNEESYLKPVPIYDVNKSKQVECKTLSTEEEDLIQLQEKIADRLSHIDNKTYADMIFDELMNNVDALSKNKQDIGKFNGPFKAHIELTNETPIFQPLRPQPYGFRDLLREHEDNMIAIGVVSEGLSNFRFNQVLAKKKTFGQTDLTPAQMMRPCTDFRLLNQVTKRDNLPIPNANDIIDGLIGKRYFSQFDLTSAYWAIEIDDESKKYTAFVSQDGKTLVYNRLPFGLRNAPSIFTRALSWTLDPLRKYGIYNFLDDVIIATETIEQHIVALRLFLRRMKETGWKIKIEKSSILKDEVLFLGFIISSKGMKADPERVKIYAEWEQPTNSRQLITFLQSLQYYKRFIANFARISAPLYELTKKDTKFEWTETHDKAFKMLKQRIINHTYLQFPRVNEPYRLTTDWQPVAISYTLEQKDTNGIYQPIAFGGRKLSKSDAKLCSYDGEILAGYHAFVSLSRYLRAASLTGKPTIWRTDNRAIEYAHKRKDIYGRLARILMFLESFNYQIEHIAGKINPADPISRQKERQELKEEEWKEVDDMYDEDDHPLLLTTDLEERETAILEVVDKLEEEVEEDQWGAAKLVTIDDMEEDAEEKGTIFATHEALEVLANGDLNDDKNVNYEVLKVNGKIGEEQDKDEEVRKMKDFINGKGEIKEEEVKGRGRRFKALFEKRDRMVVEDGILKWKWREDISNIDRKVIVIPSEMEKKVIEDFHELGHFGENKLVMTMRQHVWIYDLQAKVRNQVVACETCQARSGPHRKPKLAMKSQVKGYFNEKVQVDLITMQPSRKGNERVLTIVDVWSGYACAVPLRNGTAKEVAEGLVKRWIATWGVPTELQSDNGPEFSADLTVELCKRLNVAKIVNSPYSPFSTGKVERLNKTLKDILAKSCDDLKRWDENIEWITFYYNASVQLTTGFAPIELATGRRPVMPIEGTFEAHPTRRTYVEYVDETMEKMRKASKAVYEITRKNQATQRREFDKRVHGKPLEVGDLVRVKFQGRPETGVTTKLLSRWRGPYEIVEKLGDKTYVVLMDYRGKMEPRVVNFRNMWKVGRKIGKESEEVELNGFPEEEMEEDNEIETVEDGPHDDDDDNKVDSTEDEVEWLNGRDGSGSETELDSGSEKNKGDAESGGADIEKVNEVTPQSTDNLRLDRVFTRYGREVRPPKRLDL